MAKKIKKTILIWAATTLLSTNLWAVRPFVTDDSAVIGYKRMELANWLYRTDGSFEVWHSLNYGLTDRTELTLAGIHGALRSEAGDQWKYAYTAPLVQLKHLFRDHEPNGLPGISLAIGSDLPFGNRPFRRQDDYSAFKAPGHGGFWFVAVTQCFGKNEELLIHANVGGTYLREGGQNLRGSVWGLGTQLKVHRNWFGIAEVFNGDPYIRDATGYAYQVGFRYFVTDDLQFDLAYGSGFGGKNELRSGWWVSGGIRWVLNFDRMRTRKFSPQGRRIK